MTVVHRCWFATIFILLILPSAYSQIDFRGTPRSGAAPLTVEFTLTSVLPGPPVVRWDFGDGVRSNNHPVVTHTYEKEGLYTVDVFMQTPSGWGHETKDAYISVTRQEKVSKPVFTPSAGNYTAAKDVTIRVIPDDADIYYTVDGTNPVAGVSCAYTAPIRISDTTIFRAIGVKAGLIDSDISEALYNIATTTDIHEYADDAAVVNKIELNIFPNPGNAATSICYSVHYAGHATLYLYDVCGNVVKTLKSGFMPAGVHNIAFDSGTLPGGIYLISIATGANSKTKMFVVIK